MTIQAAAEHLKKGNDHMEHDREQLMDSLMAELARAAYAVVLRHEQLRAWLEMELDLWQAVRAATHNWAQRDEPWEVRTSPLYSGASRVDAERPAS